MIEMHAVPVAERPFNGSPSDVLNSLEQEFVDEKANILIVDDRSDKLESLEVVLGDLDQNIVRANSGEEALRYLLQQEFAVIILDISMPGMDGFETASMIRKRRSTEHTPIIFVTAVFGNDVHMARGYSLGAVDYILTPIVPEVLRTKVSVFVELYRKTVQVRRQLEWIRLIELREHQHTLAIAQDRLENETKRNRFFTLSLDMLAIADFSGRLLQLNPAWEGTLGFSDAELRQLTGVDIAHEDDKEAMRGQLESLRNGEATVYFEGRYRCKDGSYRWLGWKAAPFPAEQLIYIFARDITQQKEAEHELQGYRIQLEKRIEERTRELAYANAELKREVEERKRAEAEVRILNTELEQRVAQRTEELISANREMESFSYSVSHDLRAPLRAINGFADILLQDYQINLDPNGIHYLKAISKNAKDMGKLVDELLAFSRLGKKPLEKLPIDMNALVHAVVRDQFSIDPERKVMVNISDLPSVCGDPTLIRQVLVNLISNAFKFTRKKPDAVIEVGSENTAVEICYYVRDNGAGFNMAYRNQLFGVFQRLHHQDDFEGTGVGLAFSQRIILRHGGKIWGEGEVNSGAVFYFSLPRIDA